MSGFPDEIIRRVDELAQPTEADVLRAKRAVLEALANGAQLGRELELVLVRKDGLPEPAHGQYVTFTGVPPNLDSVVPTNPIILRERYRFAARLAIAELAAEGVLLEVEGPNQRHGSVQLQVGNTTGRTPLQVEFAHLAEGYIIGRVPLRRDRRR